MPFQSPPSLRRGSSCAALIVLSLISSVVAQVDDPIVQADGPTTGAATRGSGAPPLTSLDALRLDRRMTLLNAGETLEPTAKLPDDAPSYVVELPSHKELILSLARRGGRPEPAVRVLPEESRTADRHGFVVVEHAILRKSPKDVPGDRENLSDVTRGEPVWILDADEAKTSLLIHARDGYLGWVDADAIRPLTPQMFTDFNRSRDGGTVPQIARVIALARERLGVRYVWGGKTANGIDCSGLAQTAYLGGPVVLPRDADQQSLVGRLVATRWDQSALLPGDLLFYVSPRRGNVHHVAIYLGDGEYIEAAGPDVHISSMKPGATNYDGRRAATFGWARRVIE